MEIQNKALPEFNLNFGGVIWNSFIDYPKNIAIVLFVNGCNLNCEYCHNKHLLKFQEQLNNKEILKQLIERKNFIDAVVLCGGEPSLYSDIFEFIKFLKHLGYKVKLDSNGTNYEYLNQAAEKIDYIAIDYKTSIEKYNLLGASEIEISNFLKNFEMLKSYKEKVEFRTTVYPDIVELADLKSIQTQVENNGFSWYIQKFMDFQNSGNPKIYRSEQLIRQFLGLSESEKISERIEYIY
jgi:pyruvate formate lyase activating enzyme